MLRLDSRSLRAGIGIAAAGTAIFAAPALAVGPTVQTLPADTTLISDTYEVISGSVNPHGVDTSYAFQYGTDTNYGSTTPATSAGAGTVDVPVDYALDDLKPSTTYHYRIIAIPGANAGSAYASLPAALGTDETFTTSPALAVTPSEATLTVKAGKVRVALGAVGPVDTIAKGKLELTAKVGKAGHKKKKTIGSVAYRVNTDKPKTVPVVLSGAALKVIKKGKLVATATATTKGATTAPGTAKLTLVKNG